MIRVYRIRQTKFREALVETKEVILDCVEKVISGMRAATATGDAKRHQHADERKQIEVSRLTRAMDCSSDNDNKDEGYSTSHDSRVPVLRISAGMGKDLKGNNDGLTFPKLWASVRGGT